MGNKDNTLFYCLAVIVLFIIIVVMKGEGKNISDAIDFLRTQNVRAFELQE